MPLVSVIIPCYGKAKFLLATLKSILLQNHSNIEILIANDGDISEELNIVLNKISSQKFKYYVKVIYTTISYGVSHCRNQCIREASGKYIFTIDGDDLIHRNYIQESVKILEQNEEVSLVYSNVVLFNEKNMSPRLNILAKDHEQLIAATCIPSAHLYRKTEWERVAGYDESLLLGEEDWDFNIKRIKLDKLFARIDKFYMFYRQIDSGRQKTFESNKVERFKNEFYIMQKNIEIFCENILVYDDFMSMKKKFIRKLFSVIHLKCKFYLTYFSIRKELLSQLNSKDNL